MTTMLHTRPLAVTRGRRIALAIGLPITLAVIGWAGLTFASVIGRGDYAAHRTGPASGGHLTVAMNAGRITLYPSTDGLIHLSGTTHYSLIRPDIIWRSAAGGVTISGGCPVPTGPGCAYNYRIAAPPEVAVTAGTSSGDLLATGFTRGTALSADSGDIRVSNVAGDLRLSTASGDITGAGLAAPDVHADADSGNISLTFTKVPRLVVISVASGDVSLVLPRTATTYAVQAHSTSGTSTVAVPTDPASGNVISVSADSGDIMITRAR